MQWGAHSSIRSTSAARAGNTARSSLVETPSTPASALIPRDSYGARFGFPAQSRQSDNSPWLPSRQSPSDAPWRALEHMFYPGGSMPKSEQLFEVARRTFDTPEFQGITFI